MIDAYDIRGMACMHIWDQSGGSKRSLLGWGIMIPFHFLVIDLASGKILYIDCFKETNSNDGHAGVSLVQKGSSLVLRVVCKLQEASHASPSICISALSFSYLQSYRLPIVFRHLLSLS